MDNIKLKDGDVKIAKNPKEAHLINLRDSCAENIMKTEISIELDKAILQVLNQKLEKFK